MEIHPRLGPRRSKRQQSVERGAAALSSAAQFSVPVAARNRLRAIAGQKMVDDGSILFSARSERSQEQNRRAAAERLADTDPRRPR